MVTMLIGVVQDEMTNLYKTRIAAVLMKFFMA